MKRNKIIRHLQLFIVVLAAFYLIIEIFFYFEKKMRNSYQYLIKLMFPQLQVLVVLLEIGQPIPNERLHRDSCLASDDEAPVQKI